MSKLKLGVILGGMSSEHDVSITSGTSVIKKLLSRPMAPWLTELVK